MSSFEVMIITNGYRTITDRRILKDSWDRPFTGRCNQNVCIHHHHSIVTKIPEKTSKLLQSIQGGHILPKTKFPVFSLCYINFPCVIFK